MTLLSGSCLTPRKSHFFNVDFISCFIQYNNTFSLYSKKLDAYLKIICSNYMLMIIMVLYFVVLLLPFVFFLNSRI